MADTTDQLAQLRQNLEDFGDSDSVSAEVGAVFNALLSQLKQEHPDEAVVAAIEPVGKTFEGSEFVDIDARSLKALVDQLLAAAD
jgi:hypothetical protein